jgi:hypothetical protein
MRKLFISMAGLVVILAVVSGVALAQTTAPTYQPAPAQSQPQQPAPAQSQPATTAPGQNASPGQVPTVSNLKPFSAEADFMSLAGYLRYVMYQQSGQWITRAEATRFVQQQGAQ